AAGIGLDAIADVATEHDLRKIRAVLPAVDRVALARVVLGDALGTASAGRERDVYLVEVHAAAVRVFGHGVLAGKDLGPANRLKRSVEVRREIRALGHVEVTVAHVLVAPAVAAARARRRT